MVLDNPFPSRPISSSLSREDVIGYLLEVAKQGWNVYADDDSWVIDIDDCQQISIRQHGSSWHVQPRDSRTTRQFVPGTAINLTQLRACVDPRLGQTRPSTARTREGHPASNLSKISQFVGSAKVLAIHDPYLNDAGLDNLRAVANLTNCIAPDIQLLTSSSGTQKLSKVFVTAFFSEFNCTSGEIRKIVTGKPHRRFFLLSGGQSLIIGMSLNNVDKNEVIHVEPDTEDRIFFGEQWKLSVPVF